MKIEREQIEELLQDAEKNNYAIPHFNHSDFWDMSAIAEAAQEKDTPVFIACLPKVIEAIGIEKSLELLLRLPWNKVRHQLFIIWIIVIVLNYV